MYDKCGRVIAQPNLDSNRVLTMSKLKWFFEKFIDIVVDIIAGFLLYLILGEYISEPLAEIYPHLPTLLVISLGLTIVAGFSYRLFKSVKFHRFVERNSSNLLDFLKKWDELHEALIKAMDSRKSKAINRFENIREQLLYDYSANEIVYAVKVKKFNYVDRIQGVAVRNYDVIGNLLTASPFVKMRDWLNVHFMYNDSKRDWDIGRGILVSVIGYNDKFRRNAIHKLYWILRLVPFPKIEEIQTNN